MAQALSCMMKLWGFCWRQSVVITWPINVWAAIKHLLRGGGLWLGQRVSWLFLYFLFVVASSPMFCL